MTNKDITEKLDTTGVGVSLDHENQTINVSVDVDKDGTPEVSGSLKIHNKAVWKIITMALTIAGILIGYNMIGG